jgi:hypothetical protein
MSDTCSEWSRAGRMSWRCNRPVKAEGMCAQHLAGERRRRANDAKRAEERAKANEQRETIEAMCRKLRELGVPATVHTNWQSRMTGSVVVDPAVLLAALKVDAP